eukprot:jgi/Ulvmu1/7814/UM004_0043.1
MQHVGTKVDLRRMLDGALRREWISCASEAATVPDNPVLIRRANHALHGWQCFLMPTLVHCALDQAISAKEPCDPCKDSEMQAAAPAGAVAHNCTINFNADGSRWACVPAKCLLAGGREEILQESRLTSVMHYMHDVLTQGGAWLCKGTPDLILPCADGQDAAKGTGYAATAPRKRHTAPLISSLLREMLDAAKTEQVAPDDKSVSQQPQNRKLFAAQGFGALTDGKRKAPKPPNKAGLGGKQTAAGAGKGSKSAAATTQPAKRAAAKKPNAKTQPQPKAAAAAANTFIAHTLPGAPTTTAPVADGICGEPVTKGHNNVDAPSKRRKVSDINVEDAKAKVTAAKAAGTMAKLSIPELKVYLKAIGKPVGGKKGDLVERIIAAGEP